MPGPRNTVLFAEVIWGMYSMMDLLRRPEKGTVSTGRLSILSLQRSKMRTGKFFDIHINPGKLACFTRFDPLKK
jgi:hypothetical protein